ncbi:MAG: hypothetical protein J6T70_19895 [Bacteroidales bacterium]|nr:hypothetical protein [Bacteroidales bacterium]
MHCNESENRRSCRNFELEQPRTNGEILADTLIRIIGGNGVARETSREGVQFEETGDDRNRKDEETLEYFAKSRGVWIENADEYLEKLYGKYFAHGSESYVYRKSKNLVVKTRSFIGYESVIQALVSIKIHNILFPETSLKIVALGRSFGEFTAVLEQNNVNGNFATKDEIEKFVNQRFGAVKDDSVLGGNSYKTDKYLMQDLKPKNVLVSERYGKKEFFVIDGDFYINNY